MKKAFNVIFTILKILLVVALIGVIVSLIILPEEQLVIDGFSLGESTRPNESNTISYASGYLPDENNSQEVIDFAVYLYELANENFKNSNGCVYAVDCNTAMTIKLSEKIKMQMNVNGYRYLLKTQNEYYYTEYSVTPGSIGSVMQMFNLQVENTMFAIRSYTNTEMDYLYSEKCLSPEFVVDEETNKLEIKRNWEESNLVSGYKKEQPMRIYNSQQEGNYIQTDQTINKRTVKDAKITYDKKGKYYTIVMTLDVENEETTQNSIGNLRAGAGEKAYYTSMVETIEIWNNGYFKNFLSVDEWTDGGIMSSVITYDTAFYYDEAHLDTSLYMDFDECKQQALTYNSTK